MVSVITGKNRSVSERIAEVMDRRSGWFLLAIFVVTLVLVIPLVFMAPDEQASDNPGGEVSELQDLIDAALPPRVHGSFFIAEARDGGDFLTQAPLWELYRNAEELRRADGAGELAPDETTDRSYPDQPYLFYGFDTDLQRPVVGIYTLADAVQTALQLRLDTTLERATDDQVKLALSLVFANPATEFLKDLLSQQAQVTTRTVLGQEIDYWTSPAALAGVSADNEALGGGSAGIGGTADAVTLGKEQFARKVQSTLRGGEGSYRLWGVAIDAGLEIADEIGTAVPFIMATFIVVLVVVGISLRSGKAVLLTAVGLIFMIIWLKGLSNLVGLKSSTVLDFIVPIAMISLGADFAIHAVHRYRQERRGASDPRHGFRLAMAGVLGALTLAMTTDAVAFLSNASANIETVIGLGVGAGLAVMAAYVILGLAVPVALMRLDAWRTKPASGGAGGESPTGERDADPGRSYLARVVVSIARWRLVVLPLTALLTVVSAYYALQLEASFDVKDFFESGSDFAVGLDKLDEHVGDSGGESAIMYIRGDLADPTALAAMRDFLDRGAANKYLAKNDEGEATLQARPLFVVLDQVMRSDYAREQIEKTSGVTISASDAAAEIGYGGKTYRRPGTREQLEAVYDYIAANGVPLSPTQNVYDALEVGETLFHDPTGAREDVTAIVFGVPGTADQANVVGSREALKPDLDALETAPSISRAGLTGSPYTRQAGLDATTESLARAFPIAVIACLLVVIVAMRSWRYGVVTIVPIILVVAWLYAFMYLFGFGLNFITVTIAAISIGVGIDYAIHMTQRFREELARVADRMEALDRAAAGTGIALLASAATSVLGFTIMAFAPMPMFASYGILTAVMIFLAAAASLLVLPSLLLLVAPERPVSS